MGDGAVLYLQHRVRYTTEKPVSVEDVIHSLKGMERLVQQHLPKALTKLTKTQVMSAELLVTGVEDGSLIEDFLIKVVFKNQQELDKFYEKLHGYLPEAGTKGRVVVKGLFTGAVVVALALAALGLFNAAFPGDGQALINGDNNVLITIGADAYKKDPEEFRKLVEGSLTAKQKESAAKAAVQMFKPATSEDGAGLNLESGSASVVAAPPNLVRQIPKDVVPEDTTEDQTFRNVQLKIRASDSDSGVRGWAGSIDGIAEKRTRIIFANPSDSLNVLYKPSIQADVSVTYTDASKSKVSLIIVEKIY